MKKIPTSVEDRLNRLFDGRVRVRWSVARDEWHVEAKVAPGKIPNYRVEPSDDQTIRARDGYGFVMAIREGDRMPCPKCGLELKVPIMEGREVNCTYCRLNGRDGRYAAAYFPIDGEMFIEHLKKLDPLGGWRDSVVKQLDRANAMMMAAKERDYQNAIESITFDNYSQLVGIPMTGYTGKSFTPSQETPASA